MQILLHFRMSPNGLITVIHKTIKLNNPSLLPKAQHSQPISVSRLYSNYKRRTTARTTSHQSQHRMPQNNKIKESAMHRGYKTHPHSHTERDHKPNKNLSNNSVDINPPPKCHAKRN